MLYKRYASPLSLLDTMLDLQNLNSFIDTMMGEILKERKEKFRWEFYLHRVIDMSYEEYVSLCEGSMVESGKSSIDLGEVVMNNFDMMNDFKPKGVE